MARSSRLRFWLAVRSYGPIFRRAHPIARGGVTMGRPTGKDIAGRHFVDRGDRVAAARDMETTRAFSFWLALRAPSQRTVCPRSLCS